MANNTRAVELQREIDNLKEQVQSSVKEIQEQHTRSLEEMRHLITSLMTAGETSKQPGNLTRENEEGFHLRRTSGSQYSRMQRVEFPRFAGEDLKGWLFRCEQFFDVDETPEENKIKIASLHLEGKALQWHQIYLKSRLTRELPKWEDYIQALNSRFGSAVFEDPMAELMNLKQVGSVQSYLDCFDEILNRVELNEQYAVSCFLSGLKDEIELPVRMFMPRTLQRAVSLAKLQEQSLQLSSKTLPSTPKLPPLLPESNFIRNQTTSTHYTQPPKFKPHNQNTQAHQDPTKIITTTEMDERRSKGLCYWCDNNYTPGHKCRGRQQLFILKVEDENDEEEVNDSRGGEAEKRGETDEQESYPLISVNAMAGIHDYKTMRVAGSVNGKAVHILIDTGSTHNFINVNSAKRLGCKMEAITPLSVAVADGNKIYSSYICKGFCWKMQGVSFSNDILAIPLGGCDLVLGVQWLVELGDINWNFDQLKMEFKVGGQKVSLRGKHPEWPKVIDQGKRAKILQNPGQIASLHLGLLHNSEDMMKQLSQVFKKQEIGFEEKELQQLVLEEFWSLFKESKHQEGQWLLAGIDAPIVKSNSSGQGTKDYYYIAWRERHYTYEYHVFKALRLLESMNNISISGRLVSDVPRLQRFMIFFFFHVSQLKQHHGTRGATPEIPVTLSQHGYILLAPERIFERRIVPKNNKPITQVLVKWFNTGIEESTWEEFYAFKQKFPNFIA